MPSNNVFQYSKIRTRNKVRRKALNRKKNGIQLVLESGIHCAGIRNPESSTRNPKSKTVLDSVTWGDLSRFSSNVKTISVAETGISTLRTPRSCRNFCHVRGLKIALILLLRHFWTLNFSSLKQRKGNNIYKLTQAWNSERSSYKYSMWQRTNVRTFWVCLQQR